MRAYTVTVKAPEQYFKIYKTVPDLCKIYYHNYIYSSPSAELYFREIRVSLILSDYSDFNWVFFWEPQIAHSAHRSGKVKTKEFISKRIN